ncbi:MAG: DMT family transporter [Treponema sp.]|nr:DMT family transporter [Treponema sp.]
MKNKKSLIAIILCVLFWGFSFISIKITVVVFPPMSLGMLRFAIAIVFLYFIKLKLAPAEKIRLKDVPLLFAAGLTGVTLYFFFENNGVLRVSASEASIAISFIPAFTIISDWLYGKISRLKQKRINSDNAGTRQEISEKEQPPATGLKGRQWIGCFVSIAGVMLVAGISFSISGSILGYLYMLGAVFSWVTYCFLTRPLFAHCSRIYIVFWQTVAGFAFFIPFSIMEFQNWGQANAEVIAHLCFLGIFCSALGYLFYVNALEHLGVSTCAIFINLIPVVTVIAGFLVLGERLTLLQWLGAVLVIAGVYLSMWNRKTEIVNKEY